MNKLFTKSYHAKRRAQAARRRRAAAEKTATPYRVTVYDADTNAAVEVKRFSSYDAAKSYADIYAGGGRLGAFIN